MPKKKVLLDLHAVKHEEAQLIFEQFIWENRENLPVKIITGNSRKMRQIVKESAEEMGYHVFDIGKFGEIDVY